MSHVVVPNLANNWKARAGVSVLALAIGLAVTLATGNPAVGGIVLGGFAILISLVRYRQERVTRSPAPQAHASDSK